MRLDLVNTLSELVSIPSVNPMGRQVSGPEYLEYRVTDYLENLFRQLELPYVRRTVEPKRDNIIARLEGARAAAEGGPLVLFEAHQDTVPVDGMTIDPWSPSIRDGRMYGRGACDIKGGMTAMLGALARLAAERPRDMPTILMACTVNEEHGFSGATALAQMWARPDKMVPRKPDLAIVAEPTDLQVVVAHKGVVRWRCHTHGRAAHSSQPHLGENAIFKMARVLETLERYARDEAPQAGEHPLCGRPTLSVGTIAGGISVNTVPDRCSIEIDRRLIPGENPNQVFRQVIDYVSRETGDAGVEHETPFMIGVGLADGDNAAVAERMSAAAQRAGIDSRAIGVPFGTDAAVISAAGVPSIVFGPGSIDQAHTADEWLSLDELASASEALYEFARTGW
jgi:acetylornithine deacetylase/succinyl-diaminopimelate desuccinylase family protein